MGFYETAQRAERTERIGLMSDAFVSFGSIINRNKFWLTAAVGAQNHVYKYALLVFRQIASSDRWI